MQIFQQVLIPKKLCLSFALASPLFGGYANQIEYRKIPKISPSKYKPSKPVTQKTLR